MLLHVCYYCVKIQQISVLVTCALSGVQISKGISQEEFQKAVLKCGHLLLQY